MEHDATGPVNRSASSKEKTAVYEIYEGQFAARRRDRFKRANGFNISRKTLYLSKKKDEKFHKTWEAKEGDVADKGGALPGWEGFFICRTDNFVMYVLPTVKPFF